MEVELQVIDQGEGNPVVLAHGFPELAYSWRHQVSGLAEAGYRVIAPDMRGYGRSAAPEDVEAYDVIELCSDLVRVLDDRGLEKAAIVGHDWGANVAWHFALMHPERTACVAGLSVPLVPRSPAPPLPIMREHLGEDFYIVWFQEPGVAEAALERDVRRTLTTTRVWGADWAAQTDDDPPRPAWLSEADLQVYVDAFTQTGFRGGLGYYRNIDRNWEQTADVADRRIEQPALFLTGERDPVRTFMPAEAMTGWVTDLRESVVVPGSGHWVTQDAPEAVNEALLRFLAGL